MEEALVMRVGLDKGCSLHRLQVLEVQTLEILRAVDDYINRTVWEKFSNDSC